MEIDEKAQSNEFYKKRYELQAKQNEVLKEENKVLRQELSNLKKLVTDITFARPKSSYKEKSQEDLRQILEFQHKRISTLEKENEDIKKKYEKMLFENEKKEEDLFTNRNSDNSFSKNESKSKVLFAKFTEGSDELKKANKTILMLENKLKEMAASSAKEIVDLKAKVTTQAASLIIKDNEGKSMQNSDNDKIWFKKKDNLQPLEKKHLMSAHKISNNKSMYEHDSLFNYSKTNK